jgi:hypothetical protein
MSNNEILQSSKEFVVNGLEIINELCKKHSDKSLTPTLGGIIRICQVMVSLQDESDFREFVMNVSTASNELEKQGTKEHVHIEVEKTTIVQNDINEMDKIINKAKQK